MIRKKRLVWDEWNREHIKKHNVTVAEVEETYKSKTIKQKSYKGRKMILGKTASGRLLTVILSFGKQNRPYVVSARDMGRKERRIYENYEKYNKKA